VSFVAINLSVASQRVFIVVYFVIDSVRKLLDMPSYILRNKELYNLYCDQIRSNHGFQRTIYTSDVNEKCGTNQRNGFFLGGGGDWVRLGCQCWPRPLGSKLGLGLLFFFQP
jgi:hypothetical protein